MRKLLLPLLLALWSCCCCLCQHQQVDVDYTDECPEEFGFYADAVQCDRYYECKNGEIIDHYCPDGLVYDESSTNFAKCSFPFSVNCADRPELQRAQATDLCPRRNGYFPHRDPTVCDKFYFCVDGVANEIVCPESLIFDPSKGQCAFSDQVQRKGCSSEEVFQFTCPNNPGSPHEHPRYPDPQDCQYFYICIGGVSARRNGCTVGLVFNPETLSCDRPRNVAGPCRNWYNDTFLEQHAPAERRRPIGTPVKLPPGRKRVAVRRRRPTPAAAAAAAVPSGGQVFNQGSRVPVQPQQPQQPQVTGLRGTVQRRPAEQGASLAARHRNRSRVRTRVRPQPAAVEEPAELPRRQSAGPPKFALSNEEAIQQFRQSNRFVPESSGGGRGGGGGAGGRLTVLSTGGRRTRPPPAIKFEDSREEEEEEEEINFSAFAAVPNRPPPPHVAASRPAAVPAAPTSRPASFSTLEEDDGFGSRSPTPAAPAETSQFVPLNQGLFDSFQSRRPNAVAAATAASEEQEDEEAEAPFHTDPYQTSFGEEDPSPPAPARAPAPAPAPGRSRLQVTSIKVQPQFDLRSQEPEDFEIRRLPAPARTRTRTRTRTRQRTRARQQQQQEEDLNYYYK